MNRTATLRARSRWSALNIVLMVLGFALFWPLGLAMLAYIVWGDEILKMVDDAKAQIGSLKTSRPVAGFSGLGGTGNVAFDEYRERELKRIEEERRRVETMRGEFETFLREMHRAKDKEEFDRFMTEYDKRIEDGKNEGRIGA